MVINTASHFPWCDTFTALIIFEKIPAKYQSLKDQCLSVVLHIKIIFHEKAADSAHNSNKHTNAFEVMFNLCNAAKCFICTSHFITRNADVYTPGLRFNKVNKFYSSSRIFLSDWLIFLTATGWQWRKEQLLELFGHTALICTKVPAFLPSIQMSTQWQKQCLGIIMKVILQTPCKSLSDS